MAYTLHRCYETLSEKSFKSAVILLLSGILLSRLRQSPSFSIQTSRVITPNRAPLDSAYREANHEESDSSASSLSNLKRMTTEQLAHQILWNCRLTNYVHGLDSEAVYRMAIATAGRTRLSKRYKQAQVMCRNGKIMAYCLNTKSASTFLKQYVLAKGQNLLSMTPTNDNLINAFIVIREPMHRLLSAYLNKFKRCKIYPRMCDSWRSFAQNIAQFIKHVNKSQSNLFPVELQNVEPSDVTFNDFVDYIIHMYLGNDGKVTRPLPIIPTASWTWDHWASVVQDSCYPCAAVWKDVVLFENLGEHLSQVWPKYPQLFKDPDQLSKIKHSQTNDKTMELFQEISDSQLWFLGNVMYALDYAVLPYDFKEFCKSINRQPDSTNFDK